MKNNYNYKKTINNKYWIKNMQNKKYSIYEIKNLNQKFSWKSLDLKTILKNLYQKLY